MNIRNLIAVLFLVLLFNIVSTSNSFAKISNCLFEYQGKQYTGYSYYECNQDFDHFIYTQGNTSYVFDQTKDNQCVWKSSELKIFHLTSVPGGGNSDMHVTFQEETQPHCGVTILNKDQCGSSDTSNCTTIQKDTAIKACNAFLNACEGK